ncbi:conserved hypothetical protein [Vibrio chagasii]|nr:conserved hypothetical protein [Vibrio chagasii]
MEVVGLFAKLSSDFIDELADELRGKKVLEVFGGNGYLAFQLQSRGVKVMCTSILSGMDGHDINKFTDIEDIDAVEAVVKHGEHFDVLLMSWPTVTMAAYKAAVLWGADKDIVYLGERTEDPDAPLWQLAGCATDEFHAAVKPVRDFKHYTPKNHMDRAYVARFNHS